MKFSGPVPHNENEKKKATLSNAQDAVLAHHSAGSIGRYVFPAGTILFERGETRHCAYLIDSGTVHIHGNDEGGPERLLCALGEGEIFGEMALIDDAPRTARAVTATECEIFVIPRGSLKDRLHGIDPVVSMLIGLLVERYRFSRLNLPESIRQDPGAQELMKKLGYQNNVRGPLGALSNATQQRALARRELGLEQELRAGMERREFVPFLQPVVRLPARDLAGFEVLIRWNHPEKGLVMPGDFIPVAERTGLVQHLDRAMLEQACLALRDLPPPLTLSVNLSGIDFGVTDVTLMVGEVVKATGADPSRIRLEITESALIGDPDHAEKALGELRALGFGIALDDFGTGYSSLGYLHRFAIDTIKIDRSFVMAMKQGGRSVDIVRAIIALSRSFQLDVVAEGIETEEDVDILNRMGCDYGQGYLFSKPMPVDQALAWVKE